MNDVEKAVMFDKYVGFVFGDQSTWFYGVKVMSDLILLFAEIKHLIDKDTCIVYLDFLWHSVCHCITFWLRS